jgi:hypothetical protein
MLMAGNCSDKLTEVWATATKYVKNKGDEGKFSSIEAKLIGVVLVLCSLAYRVTGRSGVGCCQAGSVRDMSNRAALPASPALGCV